MLPATTSYRTVSPLTPRGQLTILVRKHLTRCLVLCTRPDSHNRGVVAQVSLARCKLCDDALTLLGAKAAAAANRPYAPITKLTINLCNTRRGWIWSACFD